MLTYLLYRPESDHDRAVQDLARELERLKVTSKLVEADSPEGIHLTELYDLVSRPAAVLTRDDGTMVERWVHQLPPASEISYLVHG